MKKLFLKGLQCAVLTATSVFTSGAHAATITVTNANDSGPGSLREVITLASDGDQITFDEAISGASIRFTSGEVVISKNLELVGRGPDLTILAGAGPQIFEDPPHRIFKIVPGISVTIANMTLTSGEVGNGGGGAIFSEGNLKVVNCVIEHCEGRPGAAIYNAGGELLLARTIVRSNFLDNGRGGAVYNDPLGKAYLQDCTLESNLNSRGNGAGLYNAGTMEISDTLIQNNLGGGSNSFGAGLFNAGLLKIERSVIRGNTVGGSGGGILNTGQLLIRESLLSDNVANLFGAGGLEVGGLGNQPNGDTVVVNTTIHGNSSHFVVGGVRNSGGLALINSTVTANIADYYYSGSVAGILNLGPIDVPVPVAVVKNSVIAGNYSVFDCPTPDSVCFNDCKGFFTSEGHNIVGAAEDGCQGFFSGNNGEMVGIPVEQIHETAVKSPYGLPVTLPEAFLADNGGLTPTVALLPNSPAINAVPIGNCTDEEDNSVSTDQRSVLRPQGKNCDIGAFEFSLPRGTGFWAHQCSDKGFKQVSATELQALFTKTADTSSVFSECAPSSCDFLQTQNPQNDIRARAKQALLDVWLNLTSGRLTRGRPIDLAGLTTATTVTEALSQLEMTVCDPEATHSDLANAKDLADALNGSTDDMELAALESTIGMPPGASRIVTLGLINMSTSSRNYSLSASSPWPVQFSTMLVNALGSGQVVLITATISAPLNTQLSTASIHITATDLLTQGTLKRDVTITINLVSNSGAPGGRKPRQVN